MYPVFGVLMFAVANSFFAVIDLTGKPEALLKYKIQDEKTVPVCMHVCVCVYVIPIAGKFGEH